MPNNSSSPSIASWSIFHCFYAPISKTGMEEMARLRVCGVTIVDRGVSYLLLCQHRETKKIAEFAKWFSPGLQIGNPECE